MKRLAWLFILLPSLCYSDANEMFYYPNPGSINLWNMDAVDTTAAGALVAPNDEIHLSGYAQIDGGTGSKVCSTAGSVCKIEFVTGAVTWATAGSAIQIGIQDTSTAAGMPVQGDTTFDVSATITQGTETAFANTTYYSAAMETGTKTISQNQLITIAFKLTVDNGAESFTLTSRAATNGSHLPASSEFIASAWADIAKIPNVLIISDDGTRIWLAGAPPTKSVAAETWQDGTNPDERCLVTVSPPVQADLVGFDSSMQAAANATSTITVYTDPTGTPASAGSITVSQYHWRAATSQRLGTRMFSSAITMPASTTYAICARATSANNIGLAVNTLNAAADRAAYPGGTNSYYATRDGGSGALSGTTTKIPAIYPIWRNIVSSGGCRSYFKFGGSCI